MHRFGNGLVFALRLVGIRGMLTVLCIAQREGTHVSSSHLSFYIFLLTCRGLMYIHIGKVFSPACGVDLSKFRSFSCRAAFLITIKLPLADS